MKSVATLCDGAQVAIWLGASPLGSAAADLVSRTGATIGSVTVCEDEAHGRIEIGDSGHPFTAVPATGAAGLYRAVTGAEPHAVVSGEPGSAELGWIVPSTWNQRGAARILPFVEQDNVQVVAAPRLDVGTRSVDWGDGFVTVGVMAAEMDF